MNVLYIQLSENAGSPASHFTTNGDKLFRVTARRWDGLSPAVHEILNNQPVAAIVLAETLGAAMPDGNWQTFAAVRGLRERGHSQPIIVLSTPLAESAHYILYETGASHVLPLRPLKKEDGAGRPFDPGCAYGIAGRLLLPIVKNLAALRVNKASADAPQADFAMQRQLSITARLKAEIEVLKEEQRLQDTAYGRLARTQQALRKENGALRRSLPADAARSQVLAIPATNADRGEAPAFGGLSLDLETGVAYFAGRKIALGKAAQNLLAALLMAQGEPQAVRLHLAKFDPDATKLPANALYSRFGRLHARLRAELCADAGFALPLIETVDGQGSRLNAESLDALREKLTALPIEEERSPRFSLNALVLHDNWVRLGAHSVALSPAQAKVMERLVIASGEAVPHPEVRRYLLGAGFQSSDASTWKHISDMRQRLAVIPTASPLIEAVRGQGYQLSTEAIAHAAALRPLPASRYDAAVPARR